MGLVELFVASVLTGLSVVNASLPAAAWGRSRDGRFLLLALASACFALLGGLWTWGQLPLNPPPFAGADLPVLLLGLVVAALFFAASVWPRRL